MTEPATPLEVAELLERGAAMGIDPERLPRDPNTGLYICDATVPPTEITLPQLEAALRVLHLRARARRG